jgi:hypothetical protein
VRLRTIHESQDNNLDRKITRRDNSAENGIRVGGIAQEVPEMETSRREFFKIPAFGLFAASIFEFDFAPAYTPLRE